MHAYCININKDVFEDLSRLKECQDPPKKAFSRPRRWCKGGLRSWQAAKVGFEASRGGLPSLAGMKILCTIFRAVRTGRNEEKEIRGFQASKILCTILYI